MLLAKDDNIPPMLGFEGVVAMEALGVFSRNSTDPWREPKRIDDSEMIFPFSIRVYSVFSFLDF